MKAEIANLNAQITSLTKNNEFYKNKIIEATAALNTAIGYLNQFITSPPREANLGELTRIVKNITELINQISGVLDGNKQNISTLGGTRPVFVAGQNNLIRRKGGKKSIKRNTKKRKYNKYNKQKGGFTYKTTNKRRSITTSIPSSPITSARSLSDSARGRKRRGTSSRTRK
jgi:xanthine dehydrogenase iron-sulfur cluster and FAD-binding subunit A